MTSILKIREIKEGEEETLSEEEEEEEEDEDEEPPERTTTLGAKLLAQTKAFWKNTAQRNAVLKLLGASAAFVASVIVIKKYSHKLNELGTVAAPAGYSVDATSIDWPSSTPSVAK